MSLQFMVYVRLNHELRDLSVDLREYYKNISATFTVKEQISLRDQPSTDFQAVAGQLSREIESKKTDKKPRSHRLH